MPAGFWIGVTLLGFAPWGAPEPGAMAGRTGAPGAPAAGGGAELLDVGGTGAPGAPVAGGGAEPPVGGGVPLLRLSGGGGPWPAPGLGAAEAPGSRFPVTAIAT